MLQRFLINYDDDYDDDDDKDDDDDNDDNKTPRDCTINPRLPERIL